MSASPDNDVILFGQTEYRAQVTHFGIKIADRRKHMYVIGKSGMGKSELLKNLAIQDIQDGRGLCFMDPHGDSVYDLLDYIPEERVKDVIFINPADMQFPVAFNVMEKVDRDQRHLVADGLMAVFKKIWEDQWSARMEYILNYTILALLEAEGSTLLGINRMMAEKEYRKTVVDQVTDPEVKAFWITEFAKYNDKYAQEATAAIQNKIGQFVANSLIRNIVGQTQTSFNMRQAMDEKKIVLVDISKGRIGEDASRLLGAMIITKVQLAAMSRVDIEKHKRADFTLVVDEFQNFATGSFASILSEARKFNLSLVVAHQYIKQLDEKVADAVFGNVGTIITFRVGADDAEFLEKEFMPEFMATDIVNLGFRQIYLKLMIDGVGSHAFSAYTMDTIAKPPQSFRNDVIEYSRTMYAKPRSEVEDAIMSWRAPSVMATTEDRPPRRDDRPSRPPAPFPSEDRATGAPRPQQPVPALQRSDARPRRDDQPRARRDDRGPRQGGRDNRPPRRQERPYDSAQGKPRPERPQPAQQPVAASPSPTPAPASQPKPSASLSSLSAAPVDFKGRPVEPQQLEEKVAHKDDVRKTHQDVGDDDLKSLIARALGTAPADDK